MLIVLSRSFGMQYNDANFTFMVPLADMGNHRTPHYVEWDYSLEEKGFIIKAHKEIKKD